MGDIDWVAIVDEGWRFALGVVLGVLADAIKSIPGAIGKALYRSNLRKLAAAYSEGTAIRNRGMQITDLANARSWADEWGKWHQKIMKYARRVSVSKAQNIDTLGTFPKKKFGAVTDQRLNLQLSELTETLKRLSEFLTSVPEP